jgi:hypothetical protein
VTLQIKWHSATHNLALYVGPPLPIILIGVSLPRQRDTSSAALRQNDNFQPNRRLSALSKPWAKFSQRSPYFICLRIAWPRQMSANISVAQGCAFSMQFNNNLSDLRQPFIPARSVPCTAGLGVTFGDLLVQIGKESDDSLSAAPDALCDLMSRRWGTLHKRFQ